MYFDAAASTKIDPEVLQEMMPYLTDLYGNASSHYSLGYESKKAIECARRIIASAIGCEPHEIYFTSGGSESNNWVIKGLRNDFKFNPMHIVTSNIEHHSITEAIKQRWNLNDDIIFSQIPVEKNGIIDPVKVADTFKLHTKLCSVMTVNNELGTIQPIQQLAYMCKDNGIIFHTDAVQAFGHMHIDVKKLDIDCLSASAHKIHGPKGIGFLYISDSVKGLYEPFINGGQQEHGMRASTENVAAIVGLGKATELAMMNMSSNHEKVSKLAEYIIYQLNSIQDVKFNCSMSDTDSRHVSIRIDGIRSEQLMTMLDGQDCFVSAGSACNSDSNEPSHVLRAIGLTGEEASSSIRISFDETNTFEEIDDFIQLLKFDIAFLK
jgi:cysteine desulfurase